MLSGLPLRDLKQQAWRREVAKFDLSLDLTKFSLSIEEIISITEREGVDARLITNAAKLSFGPFKCRDIRWQFFKFRSIYWD